MDVLLIAVAVIVGLPLLLLAVPVRVAFRVARAEAFSGKIAIHWMFGLLHVFVRIPEARQAPHLAAPSKPEKPKKLNQGCFENGAGGQQQTNRGKPSGSKQPHRLTRRAPGRRGTAPQTR
jgi:hypothetical protein